MDENELKEARANLKRLRATIEEGEAAVDRMRSAIMDDDGQDREMTIPQMLRESMRFDVIMGDISMASFRGTVTELERAIRIAGGETEGGF